MSLPVARVVVPVLLVEAYVPVMVLLSRMLVVRVLVPVLLMKAIVPLMVVDLVLLLVHSAGCESGGSCAADGNVCSCDGG